MWFIIKINLGKNTTLVDHLGWATFVKARLDKTVDALYYAARWANIVVLQAFFNNEAAPVKTTKVAAPTDPNFVSTYEEDGWIIDMLEKAEGTPE